MSNKYSLINVRTKEMEYTGLTAGEVYQITGLTPRRVSFYMRKQMIFKDTWQVLMDDDDYSEFWTYEMCIQWDCIRKMVLGGLKFGKGTYEEKLSRWRNRNDRKKL